MPIRQHVVTYGFSTLATASIALAVLLHPWRRADERCTQCVAQVAVASSRAVDVVFAVDTTGSMGGLIEGAKRTVWSIATHIRATDPTAALRIGLVAYRDVGDEYVTRDFALNGDLDAVFAELSSYRAAGGGDAPESVAAALDDVLHRMQWRGNARKLVFLVGDAPPARRGGPTFDALAREAGDKQILINAIRCGDDRATEQAWRQIAALTGGQFSTIEQDGGVQEVATPYDAELTEISARIDRGAVIVGGDSERAAYGRKMAVAAAAPAAASADRATYYAGEGAAGAVRAQADLVGNVANGTMAVASVPAEALPEELRGLSEAALKAEISRRVEQRKADQRALNALVRQRADYLKSEAAKSGTRGFDDEVNAAIDVQLK